MMDDTERADALEALNERAAIQAEGEMVNIARTTKNALAALQQPNTSWGSHGVARSWLRDYAPLASFFRRIP